jgi:hypothetical protein
VNISTNGGQMSILPNNLVAINTEGYVKQRAITYVKMHEDISEVQMIQCNLTSGNFSLSFHSSVFSVPYDSKASDLKNKFFSDGYTQVSVSSTSSSSHDVCNGGITLVTFFNMGDVPILTTTTNTHVSISVVKEGDIAKVQEMQKITVKSSATSETQVVQFASSTFTLSFNGKTSMPLDKDTADFLQKIQSIIPYSISILKENSTRWKIIFAASAGNVPLLEISSGTGVVETLQEGVDLSGTFTLRYLDAFTTAISFNANADEVESKLNAILPSFRTVKVQKLPTVNINQHDWSVTFPSEMGNVPMLIGDPNWLKGDGKSVIVIEQVKGGTTLVGSFRLGIDANTFTTALRPDATAMEVKEAIITLSGISNAHVKRQEHVFTSTTSHVIHNAVTHSLPEKRMLTGSHTVQKIYNGDLKKYINAYVGSEFGRGIPIYGTSTVDTAILVEIRNEINSIIENITTAKKMDIRNLFVTSEYFLIICCNGTTSSGPIVFDVCASNTPTNIKALAIDAIFSHLFDLEVIPANQIHEAAQYALANDFFTPQYEMSEACILNFTFCITKPYFRSSTLAWFGITPYENIIFNSRTDIENKATNLACMLSEFTLSAWDWRIDRKNACSKYADQKNDGVELTSKIGAYSWEIEIEWENNATPQLLTGQDIVVSEILQNMQLEGLQADINTAIYTLTYQSKNDWNSEWNGLEQMTVSVTDGLLTTTGVVNIHVHGVNDAPIISLGAASFTTEEDVAINLNDASVIDVDSDETDNNFIEIEMKAENGVMDVTLSPGVLKSGNKLKGTVSLINSALKTLKYQPNHNWNSAKNSLPEIQVITTSIAPPRETFSVKTVAARGSMEGTFVLQIDQSEYGKGSRLTTPIATNATEEEFKTALLNVLNASVMVLRSGIDTQGCYTWEVRATYLDIGKKGNSSMIAIPKISIHSKSLTNVVNGDVVVNVIRTGPNLIGGTFQLTQHGITTVAISATAGEGEFLNALKKFDTKITISKSGTDDQGSAKWVVTFPGFLGNVPLLTASTNMLSGVGAAIAVETLQEGYALHDRLTLSVTDFGHSGKGGVLTHSVEAFVTVLPDDDETSITVPSRKLVASEDVPYPIEGIEVVDVDLLLSGAMHVSLSAANGGVIPKAISGTLNVVNEKLRLITYLSKEHWNGHDVISISILDGITKQMPIKVLSINDHPTIVAPQSLNTNEDIGVLVPGIDIADPDGVILKWTIFVSNGKVNFNTVSRFHCRYIVGSSAGGKNLTIECSVKSLNVLANAMTYVPDLHWSGTDKIDMYVEDEAGMQSNVTSIDVIVSDINDAAIVQLPLIDGIPMLNAVEDEAAHIKGMKIIDVDLGPYSTLELSIRPGNGTVTFTNTKGVKYSQGKNVFHGQLDALNRALRGIVYKANTDFVGYDSIEFSVSEPGAQAKTTAATLWVNIEPVNDRPVIERR